MIRGGGRTAWRLLPLVVVRAVPVNSLDEPTKAWQHGNDDDDDGEPPSARRSRAASAWDL